MAATGGNLVVGMKFFILVLMLGACAGESKYTKTALENLRATKLHRFNVSSYEISKPYYALTAPQKFRANTLYEFAVASYGVSKSDYTLKARIESKSGTILVEGKFVVKQSFSTKLCSLRIPSQVPPGYFNFVAKAVGNVNFNINHSVGVNRKTHSLFIQTDKYLYKPGQTVLFRVLVVNSDLKPLTLPINITIYDQANNRIHQLFDQNNQSGVINSHLKLSDITPLGQWRIEASTEHHKKKVYFQVAEYVLPKFEVKVILPSYFFINRKNPSFQKDLQITTTATYTFGKPVKGYANIRALILTLWSWQSQTTPPYIDKKVQLVDGKADISLTLEQLNKLDPSVGLRDYISLFVQANVTEAATGVVLQGNNTVPLKSQRYKLKFLSVSSDNFMPGFNYRAFVQLSQADKSQPLASDITSLNGKMKTLEVVADFETVTGGWSTSRSSKRVTRVPLTSSGYVSFEVRTESNFTSLNLDVSFYDSLANETVTAYKYLNAFETRDNKYIQLSLISKINVIEPNKVLSFKVKTSEHVQEIQYQILGKGGILRVGSYTKRRATTDASFSIYFNRDLVIAAAPEARIVVFYITSTGELVADSLALSITDYFANKVSLTFDPKSVSPGDEVLLNVSCSAGSYVSLLAVDQSVLLLSAGNDITKQMVSEDLSSYSSEGVREGGGPVFFNFWPRWIGGKATGSLLENAGLFVATNYYIHMEPSKRHILPGMFFNVGFEILSVILSVLLCSCMIAVEQKDKNRLAQGAPTMDYLPVPRMGLTPAPSPSEPPRTLFPETWIWSDIVAGDDGSLKLKYVVPDTITSWIATAFATHAKAGLGITDNSAKVTVIKHFFISLNLPHSIIRGEQFALQATVFNYFGQDLLVQVSLPKSNYFKVKDCVDGSEGDVQDEGATKMIFVQNNDMVTVYFWIVATSLGQVPIEVRAVTGVAADSLIVNLLVKPEGQQQSYSSSSLIRLPRRQTTKVNFILTLPPTDVLVPDSVIIEATLIGDVLGTAINNLDQLLQMPYGCGEQNMVTLAPDVYIVKYLSSTNQLTEEIKNKALGFINEGYQRELTYQRRDGSFSAFGNSDPAGSVWLSSFVIRVFGDARDYIPVETLKIVQTVEWILRHQTTEGLFKEPPEGRVIHTDMQGGSSSGIALTAYVAITLLKNKNLGIADLEEKTKLTISYLENNYKNYSQDPYVLSILSYVFRLAGSTELSNVLKLLASLATNKSGMTYWHKEAGIHSNPNEWTPPYSRPQSNDVEVTSYVLLTYATQNDLSKSISIAKWLIKNRNAQGGFTSTQDTVLGLEALADFGLLVVPSGDSQGLSVRVSQDATSDVHKFQTVNKETALLLQSVQLPSQTTKVKFLAKGEGLSLVQINVQYNIKSQQKSELITQTLSANANDTKLDLQICLKWSGKVLSGMVLTEVNLLTGYVLSGGYEDALRNGLGIAYKKQEYKNNALSVYLDGITSDELCFTVKLESAFYVKKVKPALVKTYQYYSPGVIATGFYSPTSTSAVVNICDPIFNIDGHKK